MPRLIGILSDTHGSLDPRVSALFREKGVEHIIHAGDIGPLSLLAKLEAVAPVTAVLGNNDYNLMGAGIEYAENLQVNGVRIRVVHQIRDAFLGKNPCDVLVHGHTHKPCAVRDPYHDVLTVNPGSVSRPRNEKGASIALLNVSDSHNPSAEIIFLDED